MSSKTARSALPVLLTMDQAAEHLGVTVRTIRNYVASGALPAYRLGPRGVRVREADVEALLRPIPTLGGPGAA
jgi:excisionase family DNA binding protein